MPSYVRIKLFIKVIMDVYLYYSYLDFTANNLFLQTQVHIYIYIYIYTYIYIHIYTYIYIYIYIQNAGTVFLLLCVGPIQSTRLKLDSRPTLVQQCILRCIVDCEAPL